MYLCYLYHCVFVHIHVFLIWLNDCLSFFISINVNGRWVCSICHGYVGVAGHNLMGSVMQVEPSTMSKKRYSRIYTFTALLKVLFDYCNQIVFILWWNILITKRQFVCLWNTLKRVPRTFLTFSYRSDISVRNSVENCACVISWYQLNGCFWLDDFLNDFKSLKWYFHVTPLEFTSDLLLGSRYKDLEMQLTGFWGEIR